MESASGKGGQEFVAPKLGDGGEIEGTVAAEAPPAKPDTAEGSAPKDTQPEAPTIRTTWRGNKYVDGKLVSIDGKPPAFWW